MNIMDRVQNAYITGFRWYTSQFEPDGSFPNITKEDSAAFYNVMYLLALGGDWEKAERFAGWARRNLVENGSFYINPDGIYANRGIYFKGWNVLGAHRCGFYDLSLTMIDNLLKFQDSEIGGVYCSERRAYSEYGYMDLNATSLVGYAALATGRMGNAVKAADFIADMVNRQPEFPERFYGYYYPALNKLVTELPLELQKCRNDMDNIYSESKSAIDTDIDCYHYCLDNLKQDEVGAYAGLSMAFVFICEMFLATGRQEYRDTAHRFFEFMDYAGDKCWIEGQTTKVLWGLAMLSTFSPRPQIVESMKKLALHLCDVQVGERGWTSPVIGNTFDDQPYWVSLAATGDVLLGLAAVLRYTKL